MTETNPFRCFVPAGAEKLIIGSFPCFNGKDYGNWYYSGSGRNHFWQLLSDLCGLPVQSLKEKQQLCSRHGIALTDIAYKIKRKAGNCSDANLHITEFNTAGLDECLSSPLKKIFFTSRFVERHFTRLYPHNTIPCFLLLSPSPAANRHIGGLATYREMKAAGIVKSPYDYRLLRYKSLLNI